MQIDRKQMKMDARIAMGQQKPSIYLITLVLLLVSAALSALSVKLMFPDLRLWESVSSDYGAALIAASLHRSVFSRILDLALTCMSAVLSLGFTGVCLCVSRRRATGYASLLDPFAFFLKVLWMNIVMGFFIWLWSLLFLIPGIIAAYRYCMAPYVLLDDPGKSVMDCIRESKQMTMGHKGELFVMHLSFLGWALLSVIPFVSLFTMPYMEVTMANYYNVLSGYQPAAGPALDTPQDETGDGGWWS